MVIFYGLPDRRLRRLRRGRGFRRPVRRRMGAPPGHTAELLRFPSAEAFLFHYAEDKSCDILLLDVEMGAMNGVELAKRIREENDALQIVFITGYTDYIAEGYDVSALHYLVKPVSREKALRRARPRGAAAEKAPSASCCSSCRAKPCACRCTRSTTSRCGRLRDRACRQGIHGQKNAWRDGERARRPLFPRRALVHPESQPRAQRDEKRGAARERVRIRRRAACTSR